LKNKIGMILFRVFQCCDHFTYNQSHYGAATTPSTTYRIFKVYNHCNFSK